MLTKKTREEQLEELQAVIDAQDVEMCALQAHAAKLSAEGAQLCVGSLAAELDTLVETTIQKFRTPTSIVNCGLKA